MFAKELKSVRRNWSRNWNKIVDSNRWCKSESRWWRFMFRKYLNGVDRTNEPLKIHCFEFSCLANLKVERLVSASSENGLWETHGPTFVKRFENVFGDLQALVLYWPWWIKDSKHRGTRFLVNNGQVFSTAINLLFKNQVRNAFQNQNTKMDNIDSSYAISVEYNNEMFFSRKKESFNLQSFRNDILPIVRGIETEIIFTTEKVELSRTKFTALRANYFFFSPLYIKPANRDNNSGRKRGSRARIRYSRHDSATSSENFSEGVFERGLSVRSTGLDPCWARIMIPAMPPNNKFHKVVPRTTIEYARTCYRYST